ncbi:PREDICTED: uncharacterized protein LOC103331749 [Prunus mume]|uniref:Uncharacterized protein LOC103331749 n=1 Tax=Prunus mume TaxID=102107 RepID=A0ABM0P0H2_PRUMU|nr:PREDICTED: uncharacterized protein LOC103331749 [Prunus mume]
MDNRGKAIFSFMFIDDSNDEEHHHKVIQAIVHHTSLENEVTKYSGSVVGREYKNRERENRHRNLISDYFVERPHFNSTDFRRWFRMRKELFYHILNDDVNHKPYFRHKKDGLVLQGLSPEQKLTVVFCMLAWGCSVGTTDEYCRLGESTALESLRKFCCAVEAVYGQRYLMPPNPIDLYRLLHKASR